MNRSIWILAAVVLLWSTAVWSQTQTPTRGASRATSDPRQALLEADAAEEALMREALVPAGLDRPVNPDTYVIGPGDEFILNIKGSVEVEHRLTILPEGMALLPNAGPVTAAGLTITEFRRRLKRELGKYYRNVEIHCQLVRPRTFIVYVLGEVEEPGAVELSAPFRLDAAIRLAGGITDQGTQRAIEIRDDSTTVRRADLRRFWRLGEIDHNPVLQEGQSIYVSPRGPFVTIIGEVWHGGTYEFRVDETIQDMIDIAGGLTVWAAMDRVTVERLGSDETLEVSRVAHDEIDTRSLQPRDVIVIPDLRTFPGTQSVRVEGGRGREGNIYIQQGETIGNFVNRFVRLSDEHDLENAVVERKLEDGSIQFIPVDLKRVISGEDPGDLALQAGDVISVPVKDNLVYVTGEVTNPSAIGFQRGLPAGRYIALAGGPSSRGSIDRLQIYDTEGRKRDGDRNSMVYRGETILVRNKKSVVFGTLFVGFTSLASLIIAVIALANTQ